MTLFEDFISRAIAKADEYVSVDCQHCSAPHGHYVHCPLINRNSAEAHSALNHPSAADRIRAHAMGIQL